MTLQEQVCTTAQAKILRELGILQKSLFYYHPSFKRPVIGTEMFTTEGGLHLVCNDKTRSISTFTVAELGAMLPAEFFAIKDYRGYLIEIRGTWACSAKNEAQCRADMLIYLLENEFITADQINEKLKNNFK